MNRLQEIIKINKLSSSMGQLELPFKAMSFSISKEILDKIDESETGYVFVKNIPFEKITMSKKQGDSILRDLDLKRMSMTEGPPELFWDSKLKQLIIEDGNHRIFQKYRDGDRTFDALMSAGERSDYRPVYDGEEAFDWGAFPNHDILESEASLTMYDRSKKISKLLKLSNEMDVYNVKPNDIITVFHGTSLADVYGMINGFDANQVKRRLYGGPKHAGIFVAPTEDSAEKFAYYGEIILEIDVKAKFLHGVDYSGNIGRKSDPHAHAVDWHNSETKSRSSWAKEQFPDSFRPRLSQTWTQSSEPQALLRGFVSPNQITRIRHKKHKEDPTWYSRDEFLNLDLEVIPRADQPYGGKKRISDLGYDLSNPNHSDEDLKKMLAKILNAPAERIGEKINLYSRIRREHPERSDMLFEMFDAAGLGETAAKAYSDRYAALKHMINLVKVSKINDQENA